MLSGLVRSRLQSRLPAKRAQFLEEPLVRDDLFGQPDTRFRHLSGGKRPRELRGTRGRRVGLMPSGQAHPQRTAVALRRDHEREVVAA